jgi:hypothetical protein
VLSASGANGSCQVPLPRSPKVEASKFVEVITPQVQTPVVAAAAKADDADVPVAELPAAKTAEVCTRLYMRIYSRIDTFARLLRNRR